HLLDSLFDGPAGLEAQDAPYLAEVDAIVALIGVRAPGDQLGGWNRPIDQLPDLLNRVVLPVRSDVEDLTGDDLSRRFHRLEDGQGHVVDVHEGPPLLAAEDGDPPLDDRLGREQVDDQIEARPPRQPVDGPEPE